MRRNRVRQRELALESVEILIGQCAYSSHFDMSIARRQAAIARNLCLKFNLRLPYEIRQVYCHGCKNLILPGVNSRLRLSKKSKRLNLTCLDCGFVYRKRLEVQRQEGQT